MKSMITLKLTIGIGNATTSTPQIQHTPPIILPDYLKTKID